MKALIAEAPTVKAIDTLLTDLDRTALTANNLLSLLLQLKDEQLVSVAAQAQRLEAQAFLLRGACAAELRRRITTRLAGGRGKRDERGIGVKAQMARLATEIGIAAKTLLVDAKIYKVFFLDRLETTPACAISLAREFFVIALSAPDPREAIEIALAKRGAGYTRQQFRADVSGLRQATRKNPLGLERGSGYLLRVRITCEAQQALSEIGGGTNRTPGEIVSEALIALQRTLTADTQNEVNAKRIYRTAKVRASRQLTLLGCEMWIEGTK